MTRITDGTVKWKICKIGSELLSNGRDGNTQYQVGEVKMSGSLPQGLCLQCTTAGTSSSTDIVVPDTIVPGTTTITDGTVVWTVVVGNSSYVVSSIAPVGFNGTWIKSE